MDEGTRLRRVFSLFLGDTKKRVTLKRGETQKVHSEISVPVGENIAGSNPAVGIAGVAERLNAVDC